MKEENTFFSLLKKFMWQRGYYTGEYKVFIKGLIIGNSPTRNATHVKFTFIQPPITVVNEVVEEMAKEGYELHSFRYCRMKKKKQGRGLTFIFYLKEHSFLEKEI